MASELATNCNYDRLRFHWLVACQSGRLKREPLALVVAGTPLVLFRNSTGITALSDRCPHRGAPLSTGQIMGDQIQCPYHGWQFDSRGACQFRPGVPLTSQITPMPCVPNYEVCELDGWIWIKLSPGQSAQPPTLSTHQPDCEMNRLVRWSDEIQSDWLDAVENLLDATHTPFVHAGLIRDAAKTQQFKANVTVSPNCIQAEYVGEGKQIGWISRLFERHRAVSFGRFFPPCVAQLDYRSQSRSEFLLNAFFTPTISGRIAIHVEIWLPRTKIPIWVKRAVLAPVFRHVFRQDSRILRLQQQNLGRHTCAGPFVHWEGDLMRGWIEAWLRTGTLPQEKSFQIDLHI